MVVLVNFKDNKVWRFFAQKNIAHQTVDVYWMAQGVGGQSFRRRFPTEEFIEYDDSLAQPANEPTCSINYDEAKSLMQELWDCGIRPDGVEGTVEHVAALKAHIKSQSDMLQHFMLMQHQGVEPDLYEQIDKIKQALTDLNPGNPLV